MIEKVFVQVVANKATNKTEEHMTDFLKKKFDKTIMPREGCMGRIIDAAQAEQISFLEKNPRCKLLTISADRFLTGMLSVTVGLISVRIEVARHEYQDTHFLWNEIEADAVKRFMV